MPDRIPYLPLLGRVAGIPWNRWPECHGITGRNHMERVAVLAWNTQPHRARLVSCVTVPLVLSTEMASLPW